MKFKIAKSTLLRELQYIQGVVEKKNTIPILSNFLLAAASGRLSLKATDIDVWISTSAEADVLKEGVICLPAKKLCEIIRALPEAEITFEAGADDQMKIRCERSRFKMTGAPKENFPAMPDCGGPVTKVPAALLERFIARTLISVSSEESRYSLNGVKLEIGPSSIRMVSTDGHRLSLAEAADDFGSEAKVDVLIPRKAVSELAKLCAGRGDHVEFGQADSNLFFRVGERLLVARMLSGSFPNYELVIPKQNDKQVEVARAALSGAVRRVALMSDEHSRSIKLDIAPGKITVSSQSAESGEAGEEVEVDYQGDQVSVGFNASYLLDFFGVVAEENVRIDLRDGNSQVRFYPVADGQDSYSAVIMPLRL